MYSNNTAYYFSHRRTLRNDGPNAAKCYTKVQFFAALELKCRRPDVLLYSLLIKPCVVVDIIYYGKYGFQREIILGCRCIMYSGFIFGITPALFLQIVKNAIFFFCPRSEGNGVVNILPHGARSWPKMHTSVRPNNKEKVSR